VRAGTAKEEGKKTTTMKIYLSITPYAHTHIYGDQYRVIKTVQQLGRRPDSVFYYVHPLPGPSNLYIYTMQKSRHASEKHLFYDRYLCFAFV